MENNSPPKKIQLFITCLADAFHPNVGMSVVEILEALGVAVEFPFEQTCCGQPAFNGGFWDDARNMARQTLDLLSVTTGPIVIPSGSCTDMIIHRYVELLSDDVEYLPKAQDVSSRTYEFTQFLVDVLGVKNVGAAGQGCAAYHSSFHGLRNLNLKNQSQTLLSEVSGLEQVELPEAETCCGFGGLFAVKMSDISGAMLERKLDNIESSGADIVVGSDISCLMHMAGGLQRRGSNVQVKHIAEVLHDEDK